MNPRRPGFWLWLSLVVTFTWGTIWTWLYFSPLVAPVDIVGLPLLLGYSEQTETLLTVVLFFSLLVPLGLNRLLWLRQAIPDQETTPNRTAHFQEPINRWSVVGWFGLSLDRFALAAILLHPFTFTYPVGSILIVIAVWLCYHGIGPVAQQANTRSWWLGVGILTLGLSRNLYYLPFETFLYLLLLLLLVVAILSWLGWRWSHWRPALYLLASLGLFSLGWVLPVPAERGLVFVGLSAVGLAVWERQQMKACATVSTTLSAPWLLSVCFLAVVLVDNPRLFFSANRSLAVCLGAGIGVLLCLWLPQSWCQQNIQQSIRNCQRLVTQTHLDWLWFFLGGFSLLVHWPRWWFGVGLVAISWLVARWENRAVAWWQWVGVGLAVTLLVPVSSYAPSLDLFHDGQVLSTVWAFQQGKTLFAETVPLRLFEFQVTYLGHFLGIDRPSRYFVVQQVVNWLPIGAIWYFSWVWTKSLTWSLATCLLAATFPPSGARDAWPLMLAGATIAVNHWSPVKRAGAIAWIAALTALSGYDMLVPWIAGLIASNLVVAISFSSGLARWRFLVSGLLRLLALGLFISLVLAVCYRFSGMWAYWNLLVQYSLNYPHFYGLPLPIEEVQARQNWGASLSVLLLGIVACWYHALIVPTTKAVSLTIGQPLPVWLFILVQYALWLQRGLGRSDASHLQSINYLALVLSACLLWQILHSLPRVPQFTLDRVTGFFQPRVFAWLVVLLSLYWLPVSRQLPFWHEWGRLAAEWNDPTPWPPGDAEIRGRTAPGTPIWDLGNSLEYFLSKRPNPTRHDLTYCNGWPAEQLLALAQLQTNPPAVIRWQYLPAPDHLANPLRYYLWSPWLYHQYRPTPTGAHLVPTKTRTDFPKLLPRSCQGVLKLGQLPYRWGAYCQEMESKPTPYFLQRLGPLVWQPRKISAQVTQTGWPTPDSDLARENQLVWELSEPIAAPDQFFLLLVLQANTASHVADSDRSRQRWLSERQLTTPSSFWANSFQEVCLFYGDEQEWCTAAPVYFDLKREKQTHFYLLPLGVAPTWSWRPKVTRIQLYAPPGLQVTVHSWLTAVWKTHDWAIP